MDYKIIDNKFLWKHVKSLFTEKSVRSNKIILVEDNCILENNDKIAETSNNFFTSAVSNLNILQFVDPSVEINHIEDPILRIIEQYKNLPSIVAIDEKSFHSGIYQREVLNLDVSNTSQGSDKPTKIIKMNADIFAFI